MYNLQTVFRSTARCALLLVQPPYEDILQEYNYGVFLNFLETLYVW